MVIVANEPPCLVCILCVSTAPDCHSRPAPRGTGRIEHLRNSCWLLALSFQPKYKTLSPIQVLPCRAKRRILVSPGAEFSDLALAELEALSCAFLAVFLAFLAARVTRHHALGLQLAAEFGVELHERPRNAELYCVSLTAHAAAQYTGDDVECSPSVG